MKLWWILGLVILAGLLLFAIAGCAGQSEFTAPTAWYYSRTAADGTVERGTGATGAGARGEGVKAVLPGVPPTANAEGASAGTSSWTWFEEGKLRLNPTVQMIIGAVAVIVGALCCYFSWPVGLLIAAAGGCLIAAAWYPWLQLVLAGIGLVLLILLIWGYANGKTFKEALTTVVTSLQEAGGDLLAKAKEAVAQKVTDESKVTSTIEAVK